MSLLLKLLRCTGEDECELRLAWRKEIFETEKNIEFFNESIKLGREKLKIVYNDKNNNNR